ncbi:MAG: hypothetical protein NZT61_00295 [Deltaproteobacteria bacterium]|nr:hypothetical protein [Deltaproteobacteria bacterium]MCX7952816.1 hypothetical protein [Deltaproteobacteria bacterium]
MKIFVSCGETSGDIILSHVIVELKKILSACEFTGLCGNRSQDSGVQQPFNVKHFGSFGLPGFQTLLDHARLYLETKKWLEHQKPDLVILCDYAEFNFLLAKLSSKLRIPIYWISPPQVWAWRKYRLRVLKKILVGAALILPFEEMIWGDGQRFRFFAHPLGFLASKRVWKPNQNVIAIFPGSRLSELKAHYNTLNAFALKVKKMAPSVQFIVPAVLNKNIVSRFLDNSLFSFFDSSLDVLEICEFALIKSGSSTVEATCMGVPFVSFYRVSLLTEFFARMFLRVHSVTVANLLVKDAVPEFLQSQFNSQNLVRYFFSRFNNEKDLIIQKLKSVKQILLPNDLNPFREIANHIMFLCQKF